MDLSTTTAQTGLTPGTRKCGNSSLSPAQKSRQPHSFRAEVLPPYPRPPNADLVLAALASDRENALSVDTVSTRAQNLTFCHLLSFFPKQTEYSLSSNFLPFSFAVHQSFVALVTRSSNREFLPGFRRPVVKPAALETWSPGAVEEH